MVGITYFLRWVFASLFKSRERLKAENLALRYQVKRGMECVFGCGNRCRPCHSISLLLIDGETIEGA